MKFKSIGVVLVLLLVLFLFFGCTQNSICGDSLCSSGEENSCPTDCATQIDGTVFVNLIGANDATDLTLEYYSSSNVNYNFYNSVASSLASNWSANNSKNLSISLNQNDLVTKPVPASREVVLEGLKQGEYYFTARNSEYSYYGKAEKVLINEDKDYYVTVELKANQPIVKVNVVDESGAVLSGSGRIEMFEVTDYYDSSTQMTNTVENSVGIVEISADQSMAALFYLWPERKEINYQTRFKAVVTKDNYGVAVYDNLGVQNKYNLVSVIIVRETPITGSLTIQIVPGQGTTLADLEVFKGKEVAIYNTSDYSGKTTAIVNSDLTINLNDYKVGTYFVGGGYLIDSISVPVNLDVSKEIVITPGHNSVELEGFLGILASLSVIDSKLDLIYGKDIQIYKMCYSDGNLLQCTDYNGVAWEHMLGTNPYVSLIGLMNQRLIEEYLGRGYILSLGYDGQVKDFNFSFKQGRNDIIFKFDPIYSCIGEIDPNALLYQGDDLDLTANTVKVLANANTSAKCEYYCKEGYYLNTGKCVLGPDDRNARALWKKAIPFAIIDWNRTGDKLSLTIKNNSTSFLYLRAVYLNADPKVNSNNRVNSFSGLQTRVITVDLNTPCLDGNNYVFSKDVVRLVYTNVSSSISRTERAVADILGRCN